MAIMIIRTVLVQKSFAMPLTKPQQNIFNDPARFRVVAAGRRFGKTYLSMWEIARVVRFPGKRVFYVAPSYRMGKQIIWQQLCDDLRSRNWVKKINESDLTITLVNNSQVSIRSADNYDSMRGVSLDAVILDEAAYMSKEVWTEVLRPTLSDRQGICLMISTPQGMANWFYDIHTAAETMADWASFQYTTLEGGNVLPSEVDAARSDLDLKTFQQEYMAEFSNSSNTVYYAFTKDNIRPSEYDTRQIHVGMDFNVSKMCACIAVNLGDGLHIVDEIVLTNSNTEEMCQELQHRYPDSKIIVYPDPAGSARKTSAVGKTDHTIIRDYGFQVRAPRAHPAVKDRNNAVNRLLCDASGDKHMFVTPNCKTTIESLSKHQYKANSNIPDKESGYDHMADSCAYMVNYLYPIRRANTAPTGPETFGHW